MISQSVIDSMYDAIETLNVCREVLSQGNADGKMQGSMSWLLGSTADRLGDVLEVIEPLQHQPPAPSASTEAEIYLLSEILALTANFNRSRQSGDAA